MAAVNPLRPIQSFGTWLDTGQRRIAHTYDTLFSHHNRELFERFMVYIAVFGFLLHLLLIFLARFSPGMSPLAPVVGTSYLAAISTPFSVILFYEILLLVLSLPESTTRSIAAQFEIISLIILRNVFKDLAELQSLEQIERQFDSLSPILLDMGGGVLLFLLVTAFHHISHYRTSMEQVMGVSTKALEQFIIRKKIVSLLLSGLLFVLAAKGLGSWFIEGYIAFSAGTAPVSSITTDFYTDLFTIIIFTDVLILILSLLLSDRYHLVVRNAGFVIATILLRISLSIDKPYDVLLAVIAVLFGILVLAIYKYHSHIAILPGSEE